MLRLVVAMVAVLLASCTWVQRTALPLPPLGLDLACELPGEKVVTYHDVEPVFDARCNRCHHSARSDNLRAQRIFESSSYPFSTDRPDTLLADLDGFIRRSWLTTREKCQLLGWLRDGARDDRGARPVWRKP
ncbi:MAG: hypothetical protein AB2A00_05070 [Myxococcota bacterium]